MLNVHSLPPTKEIDPCFTLCRAPYLMTATAREHQPTCGQKRQRGAIEKEPSTTTIGSAQPPWKRAKRRRQPRQETNTAYWDSLSKLWLTRRALDELNRRNRQRASPLGAAIVRRLDLSDEPGQLKNPSKQLKRFARHGGPDLRDLGAVNLAREKSRSLLISYFAVPRTVHTELYCPRYAVESVWFEDRIEVQKYLRRLYCEDHNLKDKEDFSV